MSNLFKYKNIFEEKKIDQNDRSDQQMLANYRYNLVFSNGGS